MKLLNSSFFVFYTFNLFSMELVTDDMVRLYDKKSLHDFVQYDRGFPHYFKSEFRKLCSSGQELHKASLAGDAQVVKKFLPSDMSSYDALQKTVLPVHCAILGNHLDIVHLLLEAGTNASAPDLLNYTPIHYAIILQNRQLIDDLLTADVALDTISPAGTPLHLAARFGSRELVLKLLEKGAHTLTLDSWYRSPLACALLHNRFDIAETLIEHDPHLNGPLLAVHFYHFACYLSRIPTILPTNNRRLFQRYLTKYIDTLASTPGELHAFLQAVVNEDAATTQRFLRKKIPLNEVPKDVPSALHIAALLGNQHLVRMLIAAGADLEREFLQPKERPVYMRAELKRLVTSPDVPSELRVLVNFIFSVRKFIYGYTLNNLRPIHFAILGCQPNQVFPQLLSRGASLAPFDNVTNTDARSLAALAGQPQILRRLMSMKDFPDKMIPIQLILSAENSVNSEQTLATLFTYAQEKKLSLDLEGLCPRDAFKQFLPDTGSTPSVRVISFCLSTQLGFLAPYVGLYSKRKHFQLDDLGMFVRTALAQNPTHKTVQKLLGLAVYAEHQEDIEKLLSAGADINTHSFCGENPLHLAVLTRKDPLVDLLLNLSADPDYADEFGNTPLVQALELNSTYATARLLKARASLDRKYSIVDRCFEPLQAYRTCLIQNSCISQQGDVKSCLAGQKIEEVESSLKLSAPALVVACVCLLIVRCIYYRVIKGKAHES